MKRWFQSRTIWVNVVAVTINVVTVLATILTLLNTADILAVISAFGLTSQEMIGVTGAINILANLATVWLRPRSVRPIGSHDDVAAFHDFTDRLIDENEGRL